MPPEGTRLTPDRCRPREWIDQGALLARGARASQRRHGRALVLPAGLRPPLPAVQHADWCRNAIDRFVLASEKESFRPHRRPIGERSFAG